MHQPASIALRWLYCLAVLSTILPRGGSGWVRMTIDSSPYSMVPVIAPLTFLALGLWRVYHVARFSATLEAPVYKGAINLLRKAGIVVMIVGALYLFVRIGYRPVVQAMTKTPTASGIEFYLVGLYLVRIDGFAPLGVILFEASRLMRFERQRLRNSP
ncbi:MAG: hypothetical protein R3F24_01175 [Gammaproteobacteria bacterium]